jgi:CheY-like chemotaxis protein
MALEHNQKAIFKNGLNFQRDLLEYKPMRILLVEDDKGIVRFVKKGLLEDSFSVDVAYNGEEGLTSAVHMKYDLIVLDIMLPKMDGREVLQRIRSMDRWSRFGPEYRRMDRTCPSGEDRGR